MPYHGKDIRSTPAFRSHQLGRYVVDKSGILRGVKGDKIDLHAFLTDFSHSVDIVQIPNDDMLESGLYPGGYVLIDKGKRPFAGAIVAIRYNGNFKIRRLIKKEKQWSLIADQEKEMSLPINEDVTIEKLGVVIATIVRF